MKNKDNVKILAQETIRVDFTQHGLHLNASGKDKIVKMMSLNIYQLLEVKKKDPITLKWRNYHSDSCLINNVLKAKNEDHIVIIRKERNEALTDLINQSIRTSARPKRIPNTRSDDFLWA